MPGAWRTDLARTLAGPRGPWPRRVFVAAGVSRAGAGRTGLTAVARAAARAAASPGAGGGQTAAIHDHERPCFRRSDREPPIGIEPMTYALRGRSGPSSVVHQFTPTLLIDVLRSGHVQNHPGVLLAHPLARPPVGAGRPAPPSGATSSALRTPRSRLGLRSRSRGEPQGERRGIRDS
jgi:hypothetical protein